MIGILLALLSAPLSPGEEEMDAIITRNFYVLGFYCDDTICETAPRPLSGVVRLDRPGTEKVLAKAEKRAGRWSITLNCAVKRERLRSCYLTDHGGGRAIGLSVGMKISRQLRLFGNLQQSPRVILKIDYDNGDCPPWACVIDQGPPPLPPVG